MQAEMPAPAPIYLDYNAGAPIKPEVQAAIVEALALTGNPSSVHRFGREARRRIEDARERVAALAGARAADVIFTAGGTEANNLALSGSGRTRLLVSAIDHDSVRAAAPDAEILPVRPDGRLDLDALRARLAEEARPALLSVQLANNETGVIQPVAEAAALARAAGALVHCDAVQAAGKVPILMAALGADYLSLSAHKLGGPPGVGALVAAPGAPLTPAIRGGGQERSRRGGTENLPGIIGFGTAAALAAAELADQPRLARLRDRLEAAVTEAAPDAPIYGKAAPRLANTSCVGMPGVRSESQLMGFDLAGIAVSAGAACSSGKVAQSHVLLAMGVDPAAAACAIRVSLGWATEEAHVERFVDVWKDIFRRARTRAA